MRTKQNLTTLAADWVPKRDGAWVLVDRVVGRGGKPETDFTVGVHEWDTLQFVLCNPSVRPG